MLQEYERYAMLKTKRFTRLLCYPHQKSLSGELLESAGRVVARVWLPVAEDELMIEGQGGKQCVHSMGGNRPVGSSPDRSRSWHS